MSNLKTNLFILYIAIVIMIYIIVCTYIIACNTHKKEIETKIENEKAQKVYDALTPTYDTLTILAFDKQMVISNQKVAVIGMEALNIWLKQANGNKTIVSITSVNRGIQGSTSSFLIVYVDR